MAEAEREFVRRSEKGKIRSSVNPFNLEDEVVGPLDVHKTILALHVAGK
jgi:hypothetical protein